jgi:cytidine deaminase
VGAAILSADGRIFTGCNIESSSFGLTICAERCALFNALSEGSIEFLKIAIVSESESPVAPCGACRQLLWDYAPNIEVVMVGSGKSIVRKKLAEIYPLPFGRENFK